MAMATIKVTMDAAVEDYVTLCRQYKQMGRLFARHAKALAKSKKSKKEVESSFAALLDQFQEMGEQLKLIGIGLKALRE